MSKPVFVDHDLLLKEDHQDKDDSSSSSDDTLLINYKTKKMSQLKVDMDSNSSSEDDDLIIRYKSKKPSLPSWTHSVQTNNLSPTFYFPTEEESLEARKAWHLEILLGLFLTCTDSEVKQLSTQAQAISNTNKDDSEEYTTQNTHASLEKRQSNLELKDHCSSNGDIEDSKLPIVYYVIEERSKCESKEPLIAGMKLERRLFNKNRRLPYTSRLLQNLEQKVKGDFTKQFQNQMSCHQSNRNEVDNTFFQPHTLLYNECSISCMSQWAFQAKKKQRVNYFYEPVAPIDFRKCAICNLFGHFEVECKELGVRLTLPREEMIAALKAEELVAKEVRVQSTLNGFIKEQSMDADFSKYFQERGNQFLSHSFISMVDTTASSPKATHEASVSTKIDVAFPDSTDDASLSFSNDNPSHDTKLPASATVRTPCHVCGNSHRPSDILQCEGCGINVHRQCAGVHQRDSHSNYLCEDCYNYDSDVSSITEIEGLDGFVIEQRKSDKQMHGDNNVSDLNKFYKRSWCGTLLLAPNDGDWNDTADPSCDIEENGDEYLDELEGIDLDKNISSSEIDQGVKQLIARPPEWANAEAVVIDGISILSRSEIDNDPGNQENEAQNDISFASLNERDQITRFEEIIPKVRVPYRGRIGGLAIFKVESSDTQRGVIKFGAVAGFQHGKVLIYNLPMIDTLMRELSDYSLGGNTNKKGNIDFLSCHLGASEWIPACHVIHFSNFVSKGDIRFCQRIIDKFLTRLKQRVNNDNPEREEDLEDQVSTQAEDGLPELDMHDAPPIQASELPTFFPNSNDTAEVCDVIGMDDTNSVDTGSDMMPQVISQNEVNDVSHECGDLSSGMIEEESHSELNDDSEKDKRSNLPSGMLKDNIDDRSDSNGDSDGECDKKPNSLHSMRMSNTKEAIESSEKRLTRASMHVLSSKDEEKEQHKALDKKSVKENAIKETKTKTTRVKTPDASENDQIFQVDAILDDNGLKKKGRQYLIQWKGFSKMHNTWEREENIFDPSVIRKYWCQKYIRMLKRTKEAKDPKSHTTKIIRVLEYGLTTLVEWKLATDRVCSFCNRRIRKYDSNHKLIHSAEPNYSIIRDVILIASPEWYEPFEDWESG